MMKRPTQLRAGFHLQVVTRRFFDALALVFFVSFFGRVHQLWED